MPHLLYEQGRILEGLTSLNVSIIKFYDSIYSSIFTETELVTHFTVYKIIILY